MRSLILSTTFVFLSFPLFAQFNFLDRTTFLSDEEVKSGAPIAIADMNGDGLDDIIRLDTANILKIEYQQSGLSEFLGYTYGPLDSKQWSICIADVDDNGYNDIFTGGSYNDLKLLKANTGATNYALTLHAAPTIFLQGSNFVDIDNDGDVDYFGCNDVGLSPAFNNNGAGIFTYDASLINTASTIPSDNSGNYGSLWTDYDNDGDLDLYISKCRINVTDPMDGRRVNLLFQNDGNGHYTDVAESAGLRPYGQSWASDFADIDNDGDLDCFIINHDIANKLYLNDGSGIYTDISDQSGMSAALAAAGAGIQVKFADFDNDGFMDMLYTSLGNDHCLFKNNGDTTFTNIPNAFPTVNRIHSASIGDLNNDGFLDLIAGFGEGYNTPSVSIFDKLFMNDGNSNNYLKVILDGEVSNPNGIGARLELYGTWGKQIREVRSGESYGIMTSLTQHFGIGTSNQVDSLVVVWPSGVRDRMLSPGINQTVSITEGSLCTSSFMDFSYAVDSLSVTFFDESTLGATQWKWTFGDGSSSTEESPTHVFPEANVYYVCLEIEEGLCGTGQICKIVSVSCFTPEAAFDNSSGSLIVQFDDQTINDPTAWQWDFGDGTTSTEQNPVHTYAFPGPYWICLSVSNNCGFGNFCQQVNVDCGDNVDFTFEANDLVIDFQDISTGNIINWNWDFGDGSTSTRQNPQYSYDIPGVYTICLEIETDCDVSSICKTIIITCPSPSSDFLFDTSGLSVTFESPMSDYDIQWSWDFGDGNTSDQQNPQHSYDLPGDYIVCLDASSICGTDHYCKLVSVSCVGPQAGFLHQEDELEITFADISLNDPTQWNWTFGDGNTSTIQNPVHIYELPGTYEVCLEASSVCDTSIYCENITLSCSGPEANFEFQADNLQLSFTDLSTNDPSSWLWTFGDGSTSEEQNPVHTYSLQGNYTVCLESSNICDSDSYCFDIEVDCVPATPVIGVEHDPLSFTVNFSELSQGHPPFDTWFWNFGDGNTSMEQDPVHSYDASGTYQVCLLAANTCGNEQSCIDIDVDCDAPVADYVIEVYELWVSFTDNSSNSPTTWFWNFGDGTTSTEQHPVHQYPDPGTYYICLTASSACGSSELCDSISVTCPAPLANFTFDVNLADASFTDTSTKNPTSWFWDFGDGDTSTEQNPVHHYQMSGQYNVCLTASSVCGETMHCELVNIICPFPQAFYTYESDELNYSFFDHSTNEPFSWHWTFGDNTTSGIQHPTHTYDNPGDYEVCLTVSNECNSVTTCDSIRVTCGAPQADFNHSADELLVSFTDVSSNDPESWVWDFGDDSLSYDQNPQHVYEDPGFYEVCLEAISICGSTQRCRTILVECDAPEADFNFNINNLSVDFYDLSTNGASAWSWDFGDNTGSTEQNPTHVYQEEGTFEVCLEASSKCGPNTICQFVTISCTEFTEAHYSYTVNELVVNFQDTSTNDPTFWLWDFDDGNTSNLQNPLHTFELPGDYEVCLIAGNICGSDTTCQTMSVTCKPPEAHFTYIDAALAVSFDDTSTNDPTSWFWDFDDGNTADHQNPLHIYDLPGTYNVCLIATSICGSDTTCTSIEISCPPPVADFTYTDTELSVSFEDTSSNDPSSWLWDFGDDHTSDQQNIVHTYDLPGEYNVCLVASSVCGSDTICITIEVLCEAPEADFEYFIDDFTLHFEDMSTGNPTTWLWDFGDGNTSDLQNPEHTYTESGEYVIRLIAASICGSDTLYQTISGDCPPPVADFSYETDSLTARFTDASTNFFGFQLSWFWDFGDGNTSILQNPEHTYTTEGEYEVCLTVNNGCKSDTICQGIEITCPPPVADFTYSNEGLEYHFQNNSSNNPDSIFWDFGDGSNSTDQNPIHTFIPDQEYLVCLTLYNECGSDSICKTILIVAAGDLSEALPDIRLWPNPTSKMIHFTFLHLEGQEGRLKIYDSAGKAIEKYSIEIINEAEKRSFDISHLPSGLYHFIFETERTRLVKRVVKSGS